MDVLEKPWLLRQLLKPSTAITIMITIAILAFVSLQQNSDHLTISEFSEVGEVSKFKSCSEIYKKHVIDGKEKVVSIEEFGGVGDGKTSNTAAFRRAVESLKKFSSIDGGRFTKLIVPKGRWVTGSFNLTSNFTLFLDQGAVILGSQDPEEWPLIEALASYGRGRERTGPRHISLIHGNGLSNVVITGQNGSIDGQGQMWWKLWWNRTLQYTRGHLIEMVNSTNILISNVTLLNSPFWTVHPIYCSNVVVKNVMILAPLHSPNTDGVDPDSCTNVCVEDCYVESGDDLVAVKSGWDQYGITMARPSTNITIRRISGTTPTCSGVGIGSEMSGGISNVLIQDLYIWNSNAAVRLKTDKGRGGYITNITVNNLVMENVKTPIRFTKGANDHPDEGWDRNALPKISGIYISNVTGDVETAPVLEGIEGVAYDHVCFRNVSFNVKSSKKNWHCQQIVGEAYEVFPAPCEQLKNHSYSPWCKDFHVRS